LNIFINKIDNPNYKKEPYTLKNTKGIISNFMYKWKMGTGEYGSYEQNIRPFFWPTLNKCNNKKKY